MNRAILSSFSNTISSQKIVLISGPKDVGKSVFVEDCFLKNQIDFQKVELGDESVRKEFNKLTIKELCWFAKEKPTILICECEHLLLLKEFLDEVLNAKVLVSVVLTAVHKPNIEEELLEALSYQGANFYFPAPTFHEYAAYTSLPAEDRGIEHRLIYGNYFPLSTPINVKQERLSQTLNKILGQQFSVAHRVNKSEVLLRTLQVLGNHIGQPLSYNQIANLIGVDNETIERYIFLLCQAHILYRLPCYCSDKKYELKKINIFIFLDNGIRNAVINNYNSLLMRADIDNLWMNWVIAERIKWTKINNVPAQFFFWRSHTRQQIDFIESKAKIIEGYKFKYSKKKLLKTPPLFKKYYPNIPIHTVNIATYFSFLTKK